MRAAEYRSTAGPRSSAYLTDYSVQRGTGACYSDLGSIHRSLGRRPPRARRRRWRRREVSGQRVDDSSWAAPPCHGTRMRDRASLRCRRGVFRRQDFVGSVPVGIAKGFDAGSTTRSDGGERGDLGWIEAVHPDDRERVGDYWPSCMISGSPGDTEAPADYEGTNSR